MFPASGFQSYVTLAGIDSIGFGSKGPDIGLIGGKYNKGFVY